MEVDPIRHNQMLSDGGNMISRRRRQLVLLIVLLITAATTVTSYGAVRKPSRMYLTVSGNTVDIHGKITIRVRSVRPTKASCAVTYRSSNRRIATVSKTGVVTGKKRGRVTITVTSRKNKKLKRNVRITVKNLKAKKVSVSIPHSDIYAPDSITAKASITAPKGYYNQGVRWTSSDPKAAAVNDKGVITALRSNGGVPVIITAVAKDGSGVRGSVSVNVYDSNTRRFVTCEEMASEIGGDNFIFLDVRQEQDYLSDHIENVIQASMFSSYATDPDNRAVIAKTVKRYGINKQYILICYTGESYAAAATRLLIQNGVSGSNIYTLEGGMQAWNEYMSKSDCE